MQETFVLEDCVIYATDSETFTTTEEFRTIASLDTSTDYDIEVDFSSNVNKQFTCLLMSTNSYRIGGGVTSNSQKYITILNNGSESKTEYSSYTANDNLNLKIQRNGTTAIVLLNNNSQSVTYGWISDLNAVKLQSWSSSKTVTYTIKVKAL